VEVTSAIADMLSKPAPASIVMSFSTTRFRC